MIANQTIKDPARLLRVNNVLIDPAGIFDCGANRLRRDLIKEHSKNLTFVAVEDFFQVLANRFALAVRVSGKEYALGGFGGRAQFLDDFLFTGNDVVHRLEVVFDVHSELALG